MKINILDLTRQYALLKEEIESAVCQQMASGVYIGGDAVASFEQEFAAFIGVKHAISLNSGTDALVIALRALGIGAGDEVITPTFSFFATAEAIATTGATPVFAEVDPLTYNLDPARLEEKITTKTKAILPVHIFGQPADMTQINAIATAHKLFVIEDACQAVGAAWEGKMAGNLGDCGCFSFFPTKNLGAFGDGGMITTNSDSLAVICRALKEHGMGKNGAEARFLLDGVREEITVSGEESALYNPYKYYNYLLGYNSRLDAMQAAILSVKLRHLQRFNQARGTIAAFYTQGLTGLSGIAVPKTVQGATHVWHQYALCSDQKEALCGFLAEKGIGCATYYPVPLHLQKAFTSLGYQTGDFPVAEALCAQTVCLPIFPELTTEELDWVMAGIAAFCEGVRK